MAGDKHRSGQVRPQHMATTVTLPLGGMQLMVRLSFDDAGSGAPPDFDDLLDQIDALTALPA
jgi:hypothetical protein